MSDQDKIEFEREVQEIVGHVLDARLRKLVVSIWVLIIGGCASLVFAGIEWGALSTQMEHNAKGDERHHSDRTLHMSTDEKFKTFVSRNEWIGYSNQRTTEMVDVKTKLARIEDKIDDLKK